MKNIVLFLVVSLGFSQLIFAKEYCVGVGSLKKCVSIGDKPTDHLSQKDVPAALEYIITKLNSMSN
jgi:hypothetical protein